MPIFTTNYGLQKPLVNNATDQDLWGDELNADMDDIDGLLDTAINFVTSVHTSSFAVTAPVTESTNTGSSKTLFLCDATSGALVPTLCAATAGNGFTVAFKKMDTVNPVTITAAGSDTIDGASTLVLSSQYDCVILVSDGVSKWNIQASSIKSTPIPPNPSNVVVQTFSITGTYTPTTGMRQCIIEMVGGGGGGSGVASSTAGGSGGGGSGGYLKALLTAAQIGSSRTITIGAAGSAGASGTNSGGNGGATSVDSLLSCNGGTGSTYTGAGNSAPGGAGGTATVSTGTSLLTMTGQAGAWGSNDSSGFAHISGSGGSNPLGFGGPQVSVQSSFTSAAGSAGTGYGAGGSSAASASTGGGQAGGAGTAGFVIITEYT